MHLALAPSVAHEGWLAQNATLIVGVVGILISGLVGPSVAAWWTARREREKDARTRALARNEDLQTVVDEAAKALGSAVARLRPAVEAQLQGRALSKETRDFLAELFTLGQRLRLRLPEADPVISSYDKARTQLIALSEASKTQAEFNDAADTFDDQRNAFLDKAREKLDMR